ncbi:four helix bundle protein [Grimontia sp. S25]|uniref:Four helix bundle protein n=1 Tax=Grimontia sedimenti TaxID=2711294 RepID=A0A6M1RJM8_9GAMM|nr:four helix bundle protein [Grimontia sedimenti]NGN98451.1 four helix bundle protein [Grimontia sedimenti]
MEYEKLRVWQESFALASKAYKAIGSCKDYALKDQIRRSAVSVPSNIAEGEERETIKESVRFLYIAKGSCGELYTQLLLARDFGYLDETMSNSLLAKTKSVSKMIASLIKYRTGHVKEPAALYSIENKIN